LARNYNERRRWFVNCFLAKISYCKETASARNFKDSATMKPEQTNHYEAAFALWLRERRIPYAPIQQARRWEADGEGIKSFDFLLWPGSPHPVAAEVKGRTFAGASLAGLRGLDCWTTAEDIEALLRWQEIFQQDRPQGRAVFVFAFQLKQADVDADGLDLFDYDGRRYVFFAVEADQYRQYSKRRSPRWQTVTLGAEDFRKIATPLERFVEPAI